MADARFRTPPSSAESLEHILGRAHEESWAALDLGGIGLESLPPAIGELAGLRVLRLGGNRFTALPEELGNLNRLQWLDLSRNRFAVVPQAVTRLSGLKGLDLSSNPLTQLPEGLEKLVELLVLDLNNTELRSIPTQIGQLTRLTLLDLDQNPLLTTPPPEVVEQGTRSIKTFLNQLSRASQPEWGSKLLAVGEGSAGKTATLRRLRGEPFIEGEPTTHGIGVDALELEHPHEAGVTMRLKSWDFGGQEIYHATHQFFMTDRSLFLLVWDANTRFEHDRLYYWLDMIQARAPHAPVLVVSTHIDERRPDLPARELQARYPQIAGFQSISNKLGTGIPELRDEVARVAARLPLMGKPWPSHWLEAAARLRRRFDNHIDDAQLREELDACLLKPDEQAVLTQWLHELGEILHFRDDPELAGLVILNPQWIAGEISRVLERKEIEERKGLFTRADRKALWPEQDRWLQEHFLRLMEKFDLSYRALDDPSVSYVVALLPHEEADYQGRWNDLAAQADCREIAMMWELSNSMPAGIPTWFIAREHRFSQNLHWRKGVLLGDDRPVPRHLGLLQASANPARPIVSLAVRGPNPHSFFALLRDGLELTLARYPGLMVSRKVPCPGHNGLPCTHQFELSDLERAIGRQPPVFELQCPRSLLDVSVSEMLFGLDVRHKGPAMEQIEALLGLLESHVGERFDELSENLHELLAHVQRGFAREFHREQRVEESHCPAVFSLRPAATPHWSKTLIGQKAVLQLYCNAPGEWHPTGPAGRYETDLPPEWLQMIAPYVKRLVKVFKTAPAVSKVALKLFAPDVAEAIKEDMEMMGSLAALLPDVEAQAGSGIEGALAVEHERARGAALRGLRVLLEAIDRRQKWGGLRKVLTPEGDYLWLCEKHAAAYVR